VPATFTFAVTTSCDPVATVTLPTTTASTSTTIGVVSVMLRDRSYTHTPFTHTRSAGRCCGGVGHSGDKGDDVDGADGDGDGVGVGGGISWMERSATVCAWTRPWSEGSAASRERAREDASGVSDGTI